MPCGLLLTTMLIGQLKFIIVSLRTS